MCGPPYGKTLRFRGLLIATKASSRVGYDHIEERIEDYGRVGEAYFGGSAGMDVGEGCTVDDACV